MNNQTNACPECDGTGWTDNDNTIVCDLCDGRMEITRAEYESWRQAVQDHE